MDKRNFLKTIVSTFAFAFAILTVGQMTGCSKHDQLVTLDGDCDEAWGNIDAQYQRRMDLLPNLVKMAKRVAAHEKDTLAAVVNARASATQIKITQADLKDPAKMEKFQASQTEVAQSFGKLMQITEKYPQLQGDKGFMKLMDQVEGTENRILIARKKYNKAVKLYNNELKKVSGKALDAITGDEMFQPRVMYKAQAGAEVAPTLDI